MEGVFMRSYDLSETSLIIYWLTSEFGLIKTVAKGAKGKKTNFDGSLEPYTISEITVSPAKGGSDLNALHNAVPVSRYPALRRSYLHLSVASYFGSLVERSVAIEQPVPEVYSLLLRALSYIEEKQVEWRGVTHFEKELTKLLGYAEGSGEVRKIYLGTPALTTLRGRVEEQLRK